MDEVVLLTLQDNPAVIFTYEMVSKHSIVGFEHDCLDRWLFVAMSVNQLMAIDAVFAQIKF